MDQDHELDAGARLLALNDGFLYARALQLVVEVGVPELLADGPRAVSDLAAATGTHPDALHRVLRALASQGVFREEAAGWFALTPLGQHLRADHPGTVRSMVAFAGQVCHAFTDAMHSLRTGAPSCPETFGQPFFALLRDQPERGALFNAAMTEATVAESGAVVDAYDFATARRIIDVGGGNGALLAAILRACPDSTGVIFDQPHVAESARRRMTAAGLDGRWEVVTGDLFGEIPRGGDLYVLKWILHDWSDEQAVAILRGCRRAMGPESRLVLIERLLPADDTPHPSKALDLVMLVLLGGRERTGDGYARLLAEAGFRVSRVVATASTLSVIEARPQHG
ncbi:acetylserotonin O-methyltransferase [Goodfellowiella coeruleoviolacea]|uniref:Hydroxyneurosporene-O-methyltransferase n=1 Tax=Goodfellowiella coeruleoviolacea TaxID=334858 RepID=A0AAE3GIZ9_9PSEU|nr:acetylserotonin O-methyltransferase [Goodfellowiella coeruleoviolacea]MCP2168189.1 hydroxyneurosporene-O-methyltransferase (EC 2.1.1.-) [Goodfellowiella coeruleoviolacea]